jgi:hypothetical protein
MYTAKNILNSGPGTVCGKTTTCLRSNLPKKCLDEYPEEKKFNNFPENPGNF